MDCAEITAKCLAGVIECIWWVYAKCGGGPSVKKCRECGHSVKEL